MRAGRLFLCSEGIRLLRAGSLLETGPPSNPTDTQGVVTTARAKKMILRLEEH